jgi:ribonucleoside-diphosphate reductase beta chain
VRKAMMLLQRDESRHIAYGMYFLSRLIQENGESAFTAFLDRINELTPLVREATQVLARSLTSASDHLGARELIAVSQQTFVRRVQRIARARTATPADLHAPGTFELELGERWPPPGRVTRNALETA